MVASRAFLARIPASEVAEIFTSEIVDSGFGFSTEAEVDRLSSSFETSMGSGVAVTALGSATSISATLPLR